METSFFFFFIISHGLILVYGIPNTNQTISSGNTSLSIPQTSLLLENYPIPKKSIMDSLRNPYEVMNSNAACNVFSNGTLESDMVFSSPDYPQNYPDNIDCIKVIEAPEGKIVQVVFIDYFHIEAPDDGLAACPYDYLEMRNGMFGYSPRIDKFCGKQPPTVTKSQGRHLWLRFHSDASLSYKGFKATINFLRDPDPSPYESCTQEFNGMEGNINSTEIMALQNLHLARSKNEHIDCTWVITTSPGYKIFVWLFEYQMEKVNDCDYNALEIYTSYSKLAGNTVDPPIVLCGSLQKEHITSDDHVIAFRLKTKIGPQALKNDWKKLSHFRANYTIIRPISNNATIESDKNCTEDEFNCQDNNCISKDLTCNGRYNCHLKGDEDGCPDVTPAGLKADIFIIAFIGCLLVIGMCAGMFLNIFRKLNEDRKELKALRAMSVQSRESGLGGDVQSVKSEKEKSRASSKAELNSINPPPTSTSQSQEASSTESNVTIIHNPQSTKPKPMTTAGSVPMINYAPPSYPTPPLPPLTPLTPKGRRASSSDIPTNRTKSQEVVLYRKPFPSQPLIEEPTIVMQFVRDCACQTKESYLMQRRFRFASAPLARISTEFAESPLRRLSRPPPSTGFWPPSSASSEIGNSLERLDEEIE